MPSHSRKNKANGFVAGGIVAVLLGCGYASHQKHRAQNAENVSGILTRPQIYARSAAICQMLTPRTQELTQSASLHTSYDVSGTERLCWSVDCSDASGEEASSTLWDARTGQLIKATVSQNDDSKQQRLSLNAEEAAADAAQWVKKLGLADGNRPWQLASTPVKHLNNWRVELIRGQERRSVILRSSTHELVSATALSPKRGRLVAERPKADAPSVGTLGFSAPTALFPVGRLPFAGGSSL